MNKDKTNSAVSALQNKLPAGVTGTIWIVGVVGDLNEAISWVAQSFKLFL